MTRIAFVTPSFAPDLGGAETYTANLLAALGRETPVDVVAPRRPGRASLSAGPGVIVHRVGGSAGDAPSLRALAFAGSARRTLAELRPDVVVAQYSGLLPAARYARHAGVPLVALVHDLYGLRENLRWRGAGGLVRFAGNDRLLIRSRPQAVLAVSEATAASVRSVLPVPVIVGHPGADHVPAGPGAAEGSRTLLFVGRLVRSKGIADLARAAESVRAEVAGARLRVIGSGPEAASLPWWAEVEAGLDGAALDRAFRASGCLVLPSHREGWGLVLTEAAARGVPYVAYDIPAVREQHAIVGGGILVSAGDADGLAGAATRLLRDPLQRRALGTTGRERARALLTWDGAAAAMRRAIARASGDRVEAER